MELSFFCLFVCLLFFFLSLSLDVDSINVSGVTGLILDYSILRNNFIFLLNDTNMKMKTKFFLVPLRPKVNYCLNTIFQKLHFSKSHFSATPQEKYDHAIFLQLMSPKKLPQKV